MNAPSLTDYLSAITASIGAIPYYDTPEGRVFGVTTRALECFDDCHRNLDHVGLSFAMGGQELLFEKDGKTWHFDLRSPWFMRKRLAPFASVLGVPEDLFVDLSGSGVPPNERRDRFYPAFIEAIQKAGATHIRIEHPLSTAFNECKEELGLDAFDSAPTMNGNLHQITRILASWRDGGMQRITHVVFAFPIHEDMSTHAFGGEGRETGIYLTGRQIRDYVIQSAEHFLEMFGTGVKNPPPLFILANVIASVQKYLWVICPLWSRSLELRDGGADFETQRIGKLLVALLETNARIERGDDKYAPVDMPSLIKENTDNYTVRLADEHTQARLRALELRSDQPLP